MKTHSSKLTQRIWGALSIGNPVPEAIDLVVRIESVRREDGHDALPSSEYPHVEAFVRRLQEQGGHWLSAPEVGTVLGLERIVAPEQTSRASQGWRGIIPRGAFDQLREDREVAEKTQVSLLPRERRQVLFTLEDPASGPCARDCKDFFVLNVFLTNPAGRLFHQQPYVFGRAQAHASPR